MSHAYTVVPAYKAVALLNQAAPVQNTWYTVLDTTRNCRLLAVSALVETANEDLGVRITVDGVLVNPIAVACTFNTTYYLKLSQTETGLYTQLDASNAVQTYRTFIFEGRSVKVEIRKTTAAGAGNIKCSVVYAQY